MVVVSATVEAGVGQAAWGVRGHGGEHQRGNGVLQLMESDRHHRVTDEMK